MDNDAVVDEIEDNGDGAKRGNWVRRGKGARVKCATPIILHNTNFW